MRKIFDDCGIEINLGDILISEYGYAVVVVRWPGFEEWVGKLICKPGHSCEDIPYALNDGDGYTKFSTKP